MIPSNKEKLLCCTKLSRIFRTAQVETAALQEIDLALMRGDFLAMMGPSGCGKSTLLNVLGMLDSPTSGKYEFLGEDVSNYSEQRLASIRKKHIGFIFQSFNLIEEMTVAENVGLALLYHDVAASVRKDKVGKVLERLNMTHRANHFPSQLSGGQQQRVAVARALVAAPDLILADEPTGNLDSVNGDEVMGLLSDLNAEGTSIIMVTHSEHHASYAGRVVHLLDGQVVSAQERASYGAGHAPAQPSVVAPL